MMPTSPVARLVRPTLLVVLGMFLAQTSASIAAQVSPAATTYTRSASCPGFGFYPLWSYQKYGTNNTLRFMEVDNAYLVCALDLPTGGVVNKRLSDSSISYAAVDNTRYTYWFQCKLDGEDDRLGIHGVNLTYRISSTKG